MLAHGKPPLGVSRKYSRRPQACETKEKALLGGLTNGKQTSLTAKRNRFVRIGQNHFIGVTIFPTHSLKRSMNLMETYNLLAICFVASLKPNT
jgi:hypothetical protein